MANGTSEPYHHIDLSPEYNRIIVALTGIRDDIRLLRRRIEDHEQGVVTNNVMNDLQRALLAVNMSTAAGNNAEAVRQAVQRTNNGEGGFNGGAGTPAQPAGEDLFGGATTREGERAAILEALGQDPAETKTLIRVGGLYYWEADATAGPDDGLRGSIPQTTPYAQGAYLGYHKFAENVPSTGTPAGPPDDVPHPSIAKKRWPAPRAEGTTALPVSNPNADLINPITGEVVGKDAALIAAESQSGSTSPTPANPDQTSGGPS
jgi:hypothetical protein